MMMLSMCFHPNRAAALSVVGGNVRGAVIQIMDKDERYTEIDLVALLKAFWRHVWLILAAIAVMGGLAFSYARFIITPMYTASALMYVNNNSLSVGSTKVSLSYSDLTAAKSLVDTYVVILNARTTLNEVIRTSGVDYTYKDMQDMVSAGAVNSTEVVQIDVTMPDPQEAERVANTITKVLPGRIADIIDGSPPGWWTPPWRPPARRRPAIPAIRRWACCWVWCSAAASSRCASCLTTACRTRTTCCSAMPISPCWR